MNPRTLMRKSTSREKRRANRFVLFAVGIKLAVAGSAGRNLKSGKAIYSVRQLRALDQGRKNGVDTQ
jgi:hypothetical protein